MPDRGRIALAVALHRIAGGRRSGASRRPLRRPTRCPIRIARSRTGRKLPEGRTWGSTSAVDIDPDGTSVWVGERCGAFAPPVQLKPASRSPATARSSIRSSSSIASGKLVKSFGAGLLHLPARHPRRPRGQRLGRPTALGQDGKGHQVFKFSPDGKVLLTLGKAGVAGQRHRRVQRAVRRRRRAERRHLRRRRPRRQHQRAHREVRQGRQVHQDLGQEGLGARASSTCPHALAMDSQGRLFVGDRSNNRIQIFDQDGKFLDEWKQFSRPSGIYHRQQRHHLRRRLRIGVGRKQSRRLEARHPHRQRARTAR